MLRRHLKPHVKTVLAILWFVFTFSLVAWWWIFFLIRFQDTSPHRMFAWEGSILLSAILIGGAALVVFTYRDQKRHQRLRFFFSTFSHDIKTSIARLRLQAEVLEEDLSSTNHPVMKRLIQDIQRLDLQLENSLFLAHLQEGRFVEEDLSLNEILLHLRNEFSDLSFELEKEATIHGDRRALLIIFRNLLQNSVLHGKASTVRIKVRPSNSSHLELSIEDDGLGFHGDLRKLGSELLISTDSRGNGIGLYLTKSLLQKMKGDIHFQSQENAGFKSLLKVKGHL